MTTRVSALPPAFRGRALVADQSMAEKLPAALFPGDNALETEAIKDRYRLIEPGRSLLLTCDSTVMVAPCARKDFQLGALLNTAAQAFGVDAEKVWPTLTSDAETFRSGVSEKDPPLAPGDFELLAIVNRADLAEWKAAEWAGAEFRFVFAPREALGSANHLTLIVEFVLDDFSWEKMQVCAAEWVKLRESGDLAGDLGKLWSGTCGGAEGSRKVRIRTNRFLSKWKFGQWNFDKGSFAAALLDGQISLDVLRQAPPEYLALWSQKADSVKVPTTPTLTPLTATHPISDDVVGRFNSLPTPTSLKTASFEVRTAITMQQCTFCHGTETGNPMQHIRRDLGGTIQLSKFLKGTSVTSQTPYEEIESSAFHIPVTFCTSNSGVTGIGSCEGNRVKVRVERKFNDIARRRVFLAKVLAATSPAQAGEIMQSGAAGYAH